MLINFEQNEAAGWKRDELETLAKLNYLKVQPCDNVYDWFDDVVRAFYYGQILPVKEINLCGSRKSRKTYQTIEMIIKLIVVAIKTGKKVAVYAFRWSGSQIAELRNEIDQAIDKQGLNESTKQARQDFGYGHYKFRQPNNKPRWDFIGGSFIQLQGIHTSTKNKKALKGLSKCDGYDLAVIFREEANEYNKKEFQAIDFAVRGAKQLLKINASNPDSEFEYFIDYCIKHFAFDKSTLENFGYQMKVMLDDDFEQGKVFKNKKVFMYTNFQINPYLSPDEVIEFFDLKITDYYQYEIWGLGMPGKTTEAVFARYMDKLDKGENFEVDYYSIGVDLGQSDAPTGHPTAAEMIGISKNNEIKVVKEYFHTNATMVHKDPDQIAHDLLDMVNEPIKRYKELQQDPLLTFRGIETDEYKRLSKEVANLHKGTIMRIDYGAGGAYFIDIIKRIKDTEYYMPWLTIQPVDKSIWFIKDRVDLTINLISNKILKIDKDLTPNLFKQMSIMQWKIPNNDDQSHKLEVIDLNDDTWDALMYSLMFLAKQSLKTATERNSLYEKRYRHYD